MAGKRYDETRVQVYLNKRSANMFVAEAKMMMRSESEHASEIIKAHQSKMTETNQKMLLEHYHKMKCE